MPELKEDEEMNDEDERRNEMAGFCPPPGIVHESLMVKKYYLTENQIIYFSNLLVILH